MAELREQMLKWLEVKKPMPLLIVNIAQHNFMNLDTNFDHYRSQYHLFESTVRATGSLLRSQYLLHAISHYSFLFAA